VFPDGVFFAHENAYEDRQHIYTLYGKSRPHIILDLDFMPGVTPDSIHQSMVLHFNPVKMPKMFDITKLRSSFECKALPVTIQPHKFIYFDEMHKYFKEHYAGKRNVSKVWSKESSFQFLVKHEGGPRAQREQPVFQKIDWAPKAGVRNNYIEEVDPFDQPDRADISMVPPPTSVMRWK
jgi:hypothetical protein